MKLKEYLDFTKTTNAAFAKKIGVSPNYIYMICRGLRRPGANLAKKIEVVTDGVVPLEESLFGNENNIS